ncbi:aminopeptidase 2 [Rhypophila sp. PSN 637]
MSRLPKNVTPTHYELDLNLDLDGLTFCGSVISHLRVDKETTSIVINSRDLELTSTEIIAGEITHVPTVQHGTEPRVTLNLATPLSPGSKVELRLLFGGTIKESGQTPGLKWQSYKHGDNRELKRAIYTTCEPIGARCIFPCLDEPDFKATLSTTVTINQDLTCLSNMDVASSEVTTSSSGTSVAKRVVFNTTPPMSTYLICFVIGEFEYIENKQLEFPVRVYGVRGTNLHHGSYLLDVAIRALDLFQDMFDMRYPLPKPDLVAFPEGGGLENWGCIVFGERFLLLNPETTAAKTRQTAVETLCHEIAHQWFGNLVTMAWWDDLWLNEAFAQWAGFYAVDHIFPRWDYWTHFVAGDPDPEAMTFYQGALDLDSTRASHPIYNPDASPHRFGELFDNITYMKGASLLRMLCQYLGTDVFIAGVKEYLQRHVFSNATSSDLWCALTVSSGMDVARLMSEWTKHAGYPLITLSEDKAHGGNGITLEQHRYLQSAQVTSEEDENLYHVPLNLKTGKDVIPHQHLLLTSRKQTILVPDLDSYLLNGDRIRLYRVSYPPSRLQALAEQISRCGLQQPFLSPQDRVGLISDVHALVSSSLDRPPIHTADLLNLLFSFWTSEPNHLVYRHIFYTISKIKQAFLFASPEIYKGLDRLHQILSTPLTLVENEKDSWKFEKDDNIPMQIARSIFFSQGIGRVRSVDDYARHMFDGFIDRQEPLNPNIRKYIFQAMTKSGDVDRFNAIIRLARKTPSPEIRTDAFVSLGYAEDPALIQRALKRITHDDEKPFSSLEKLFLLNALRTHRAGAEAAWTWLRAKWDNFARGQIGNHAVQWYTGSCTDSLSTRSQLGEVEGFAASVEEQHKNAFEQAVVGIKARMNWVERDGPGVEAWLRGHSKQFIR